MGLRGLRCRSFPQKYLFLLLDLQFLRSNAFHITAAIYGLNSREMISGLPSILPGYLLGLKEIQTKFNFTVEVAVINNTFIYRCEDIGANLFLIPEFYYKKRDKKSLFLLFYIGCDDVLQFSSLSAEWNTLLIGSGGWTKPSEISQSSSELSVYATTVPLSTYSYPQIFQATFALLKLFSWTSASVIHVNHPTFIGLGKMLLSLNENLINQFRFSHFYFTMNAPMNNTEYFQQIRSTSRVILLLMPAQQIRRFTAAAYKEGLTGGDYVFIALEPFENERRYGSINQIPESEGQVASQTLIQLTPNYSAKNAQSDLQLMNLLKNESIKSYGAIFWPNEKPNIAMSMYRSVEAVGIVLYEASQASMDLHDGRRIAKMFENRDFPLKYSHLRTDHNRAIIIDFCVRDYDPGESCFTPVLYFDAARGKYSTVAGRTVNWHRPVAAGPPPNEPLCGFRGEYLICKSRDNSLLYIAIGIILIPAGICCMVWIYFRRQLKKKDPFWKLNAEELTAYPDRSFSNSFY